MHRPKKNTVKNPTLPDDQQVDERHLVDASESADISFEDRVSVYWMENKGFITGCITALLAFIVIYQGMGIYKEYSESRIQAAYSEALANDALEDFARAHAAKPLGGLAALTLADEAYGEKDFERANGLYTLALPGLKGSLLEGRAHIGLAFSLYSSGQTEAGLNQLNGVAANRDLPQSARAEAAYHLAVEADAAGQSAAFDDFATQIADFPLAGPWQQRLDFYLQQSR